MNVTAALLVTLETRFSPTVGAAPAVFSQHERTRTDPENAGGDKMAADRNGYADVYAQLLSGFDPQTVVELGVFQGVSMALWCELFPAAQVIGLDLSFDRYHANVGALTGRGAFARNAPLLREWDAYSDNVNVLDGVGAVDLFVDDGPHTADAIVNTVGLIGPLMADGGIYVVEDFPGAGDILARAFPDAREIVRAGSLSAARL